MNRRDFLKFLIATPIAAHLDIEKLLWIPGEKTIFLPSDGFISISEIVAMELERVIPQMRTLFERDDMFYKALDRKPIRINNRTMSIPLIIKPGHEF